MQTYFICPNEERISIKSCQVECIMNTRCAPKKFLMKSIDREWNGMPSVTQLLLGTREAYLKIVNDYASSPLNSVYALFGSAMHSLFEGEPLRMELEGITGEPDDIEQENGNITIIDYKVIGSYKMGLMIGMIKTEVPSGEFYKNGKEKMKKIFNRDWDKADNWEYTMQLNMYMLMKASQYDQSELHDVNFFLKNFCIIRDGGIQAAYSKGISFRSEYLDVKILDSKIVMDYFKVKKDALLTSLETKKMPSICSSKENWNGRKCKDYCDVVSFCPADDIEKQTGF